MEENNNNNDDVMASVHSTVFKESESLEGKCIKIEGYDFNQGVNYSQLLKSMVSTGFQASNFGDAIQVVNQMLDWSLADEVITDDCDEEERESEYRKSVRCKVFLGFTSNLISSGVRDTVRYLVQHHMVDVVVTTAGGIEEDLVKCLAPTFKGDFALPGAYLRSKGLNRIGNLLVPNDNYCKFEDWIIPIFDQMLKEQNEEKVSWTPSKVIARLGKEINDESSYLYWAYKEHHVRTGCASVSVIIYGDQDKPALITYPDLALNHMSCFQGLFFWPEAASMLLHNFCIYHICPPGHELGAAPIRLDDHVPSVDDLADQILEVLNYFGLDAVMCMGVTPGAYILTLFAMKYRERVIGLILVSPVCKSPSWSEWFYNKVMSNLLYFYGMCGLLKEFLIQRYFSKEIRGTAEVPESDIVQACRRLLDERQSINVLRFLQAINRRPDITDGLKRLRCRTLVFVGDSSPFHSEALHMISKLDKRYSALVEVQACGSMVSEEEPHAMLIPMEYFFMGYGLYRPCLFSDRSPLSLSCISPELLSPESMGLNLKPIKTRVAFSV